MVGRDGLRRIGLHIDGDVVRADDEFTICHTPDGNRVRSDRAEQSSWHRDVAMRHPDAMTAPASSG